ncbi:FAD-binding oxidoreductase [Antarcticibacterium flavum]|uniref:FAD-binding oxidoreductase n=1 Tax=Antarcticibacterium flavum TaxID=2058175 RepID=A0A5B7X4N2_9FLAO|nr:MULTISPECIES: FAD-dependent oxidoreductase [Antarcticibacterium]MCM4160125.1 FAD-dependent oxidoreductase [Antarcticibacterium sp. W02-3]QCY69678.1 FAD-binding oxidoreductase [Antarcticibacterium flavum]
MTFSYWERQSWFSNVDFTIIGSGIVGLNAALDLKQRFPNSKVLVLERGLLPNGASTKNAGFACFGSISEILEDLKYQSEEEIVELVKKRLEGLELLRKNLGDDHIDYQSYGGYELFTQTDEELYNECLEGLERVNELLRPVFEKSVFSVKENTFKFQNIKEKLVYSAFEGQIDTGKMMTALLHKVQATGVKILNNVNVDEFAENENNVEVVTKEFSFKTGKLLIANNGFASQLGIMEVKPARAQVLITKPIKDLHIQGTFHLEKGYYYFRNINGRILLGGGRNLDLKAEETTEMELTALIQNKLEELLQKTILPQTAYEIDHRWTGIMGVGNTKKPVVKQTSNNIFCGVRLGGMGVAIGSLVGRELGQLIK